MRHVRDPENICAGLLIVTFFLPWISVLGASVAGYQFHELGDGGALAWVIPLAALGLIATRVSGVRSTALSVIVGLLPLVWFLLLLGEEGSALLNNLQIGAWLSVLAGLALVAAAAARQAQQPATTGAEGTDASGAAEEEIEERA